MHKPKKTKLNVFNAKNVHENRSYTKASLVKKKKKKNMLFMMQIQEISNKNKNGDLAPG